MKQKFKIISLAFLPLLFISKSNAQIINTSITIKSPYSLVAKDYIQQGNNVMITMTNTSGVIRSPQVFTSLEGVNNNIHIALKPSYKGPATLYFTPGETKRLTLNQLQAFNGNPGMADIAFHDYDSKRYFNNENLPEGLYKLCINLKEMGYSPSFSCITFLINSYDPPIALNPKNNAVVTPLQPQNILFNWTPTGISGKTQYELKLVDLSITPVNNPNDAFKNNVSPFFQQKGIATNTLVYDNSKPNLLDGHTYALEITAYDPFNSLLYKNKGRSQIIVFMYKKAENKTELIKTDSLKNVSNTVE
jgi:hypothetical protein